MPVGQTSAAPQHAPLARASDSPDMQGFPRDMQGRVVLVTVIAMAADLFLPWLTVNGSQRSVISLGAPAVVALPVLGAALLPVVNSALRRSPAYVAMPMIAGALCVGAGGVLWMILTYLSYQSSFAPTGTPGEFLLSGGSVPLSGPDVGIYLFILGGAVLVFSGYSVFLAAASVPKGEAAAPIVVAPATIPAPPGRSSVLANLQLQPGPDFSTPAAPLLTNPSRMLLPANEDSGDGQPWQPGVPAATYAQLASSPALSWNDNNSAIPQAAMTPDASRYQDGASAAAPNESLRIPLPGSAEWNEAPRQAEYARPSLGWQRGPRARR